MKLPYVAILLILAAIGAWAEVVSFAQTVQNKESSIASELQSQQQAATARSSSVRLHALAIDTASERAILAGALPSDIVSIANTLQAAGRSTGVSITLSGALPESAPSADASLSQVRAIGFVVEGSGSFPALMRVAQLLETLPFPSSVQQLDIQRTNDAFGKPTNTWHMNAYVHVLTTADISS